MSAIGLERAHVVGHSFGGGVAQWLLLEQRARIDRLALVAPGGLGREVGWGLRLAAFPVLGPMVAPPLVALAAPWAMRLDPKSFARPEPVEIAHAAWTIRAPLTGRAFRRTVHGCIDLFGQHMQAWQRVHEVESLPPLALFWGESDPVIPARHGRRASERLPGATLTLYPGCGHFPHLEAHERFAADLDRFLDDRERARARVRKRPATRRRSGVWAAVRRWLARAAGALRRGLRALNEELVAPGRDQASGVRRQASGTARSLIPRPPAPAS
jgi:pimeloyl-ACP methyl ester carboxylesterase